MQASGSVRLFLAMELNANLNAIPQLQKLRSNSSGGCIRHAILFQVKL